MTLKTKSLLIIDERKGRKIASELGLDIIGLLGVVVKASKEKKISNGILLIEKLEEKGFRISSQIKSIIKSKLLEEE